jgi:hypothetical protein
MTSDPAKTPQPAQNSQPPQPPLDQKMIDALLMTTKAQAEQAARQKADGQAAQAPGGFISRQIRQTMQLADPATWATPQGRVRLIIFLTITVVSFILTAFSL